MEKIIGKITHYFPKIGVAVVHLTDDLNNGDQIKISGTQSSFTQVVSSMQVEHQTIDNARKGQDIGMKVSQPVRPGDAVYKVS